MVGSRAVACLLLLSLLALPATGSTTESLTGGAVAYQFDGDSHHDAPDACDDAAPTWSLPMGGKTDGMLVPPDDLADVFVVDVPAGDVGARVKFSLMEGLGGADLDLDAFAPGCAGDVFAPRNQPVPYPAPPVPAAGERQVALAQDAEAVHCGSAWIFVATGLDGLAAPASLHAAWTDGSEATVPLDFGNPQAGVYVAQGPAFTLKGAWLNVPTEWTGRLLLFQDVCDAVDGGAVYGDPAQRRDDRISFTPVRPGLHRVVVTFAVPAPAPSTTAPMTCHFCAPQLEHLASKASYVLAAEQQDPPAQAAL